MELLSSPAIGRGDKIRDGDRSTGVAPSSCLSIWGRRRKGSTGLGRTEMVGGGLANRFVWAADREKKREENAGFGPGRGEKKTLFKNCLNFEDTKLFETI